MKACFKRRKVWHFVKYPMTSRDLGTGQVYELDVVESWWGDCPKWAAAMRVSRPDLREVVGIKIGPKSHCSACAGNYQH